MANASAITHPPIYPYSPPTTSFVTPHPSFPSRYSGRQTDNLYDVTFCVEKKSVRRKVLEAVNAVTKRNVYCSV